MLRAFKALFLPWRRNINRIEEIKLAAVFFAGEKITVSSKIICNGFESPTAPFTFFDFPRNDDDRLCIAREIENALDKCALTTDKAVYECACSSFFSAFGLTKGWKEAELKLKTFAIAREASGSLTLVSCEPSSLGGLIASTEQVFQFSSNGMLELVDRIIECIRVSPYPIVKNEEDDEKDE